MGTVFNYEYTDEMKYVGAHVSISGGVATAPARATEIGATALGIFTKNQRQWKAKELTDEDVEGFASELAKSGIRPEHVVVHDSYLINIGNPDQEKRTKSFDALLDEVRRVETLGLRYLNFHPGSGRGEISEDEAIVFIAEGVNEVIAQTKSAVLLIESTAGQGAHVGYQFEQLASMIDQVESKERIGVCVDTCHMFAAGYDIRTGDTYEKSMTEFDQIVGFDKLLAVHLNDAKVELASRVDRHHSIGAGKIGWGAFESLMNDPRFDDIPIVLETPDPALWANEISRLLELSK